MAERKKSTEELVQVEVELSSWDGRLPLNLEVIFGNPIHHGSIRCLQHRQRHLSWEGHSVMFLAAHEEIWEGLSSSYDFITVTGHHWAKLRSSWQARCCRSGKSFASRIFLDKEAVEITALLPPKKTASSALSKINAPIKNTCRHLPQCLHDPGSTATTPTSLLAVYSDDTLAIGTTRESSDTGRTTQIVSQHKRCGHDGQCFTNSRNHPYVLIPPYSANAKG